MKTTLLMLAMIGTAASAHAAKPKLADFIGDWKEIGFRCEGAKSYSPRDDSNFAKYLTIGDGGVYFHRVEVMNRKDCSSVQSAGKLMAKAEADRLDIKAKPVMTVACGQLQDDLAGNPTPFAIRFDQMQDVTYLIISGDPDYQGDCANPVIERVYSKM